MNAYGFLFEILFRGAEKIEEEIEKIGNKKDIKKKEIGLH